MAATFKDLSPIVNSIFAAVEDDSLWPTALKEIVCAFEATGCALLLADAETSDMKAVSIGSDQSLVNDYNEYYGRFDPIVAALRRVEPGVLLTGDQFCRDSLFRSEFFIDWALPNDLGDGIFVKLYDDELSTAWLSIAAPVRQTPFASPEKVKSFRFLVPHLVTAARLRHRIGQLSDAHDQLLYLTDRLQHGLILVRPNGMVIHANAAAMACFQRADPLAVRSGGFLATRNSREEASLYQLIWNASHPNNDGIRFSGSLLINGVDHRRSLAVHVQPLMAGHRSAEQFGASACIVIAEINRRPLLGPELMQRWYGLTRMEAEVACAVLSCEGLQAVADQFEVSISTVRIHLQRVYDKTGVHRQSELVRLMLTADAAISCQIQ